MLLVFVVFLLVGLWSYSWTRGQYWRRRGVPYEYAWPLLGSRPRIYFLRENVFDYAERIYWKYQDASAIGLDTGARRELFIRDLELVRHVFITDFPSYADRGLNDLPLKEVEPLRRHMLNVDGELWRWFRRMQSPAFSPASIRVMFSLISERAERLRTHVASLTPTPVDARRLMVQYAVDFFSACGFGIDADTINNEDNVLNKMAAKIFRFHLTDTLAVLFKEMFPRACKKVKYLSRVEKDIIALFTGIQKDRDYKPSERNDFMDLLLEIRHRQSQEKRDDDLLLLDDKLLAAQAFLFFVAGFETTSTATSYTLHLLAQHPEAQERARDEVLQTLARHNGVMTYEAVKEMKYLTWSLKESMRLFPPIGNILRQVSRPCYLPGVGPLEPGIRIMLSVRALHRDPRYFPDPDEFRPERFRPANLTSDAKLAYMPFGAGPRCCIGEQLGLLVSVAGLASVLMAARASPAPSAHSPRPHLRAYLLQAVQGGLPVIFHSREQEQQKD